MEEQAGLQPLMVLPQTVVELVGVVEMVVLPGLRFLLRHTVPQQMEVDLAGAQVVVQLVEPLPVVMGLLRLPLQATELHPVEEAVQAGVETVEVELQDLPLHMELHQMEVAHGQETEEVTAVEDLQALMEHQHLQHPQHPTEHLLTAVGLVGMQVEMEEMAEDLQAPTEHLLLRHHRHHTERLPMEVVPAGTQEVEMEEADLPHHMEPLLQQRHLLLTEHLPTEGDQAGAPEVMGVDQVGVLVETVVTEGGLQVPMEHQLPLHRVMERLQTAEDPVGAEVMEAVERQLHLLPTELLPPPHHPTVPPLTEEVLVGVGEVVDHPQDQHPPVHTELLRRTEVDSNTPQTVDTYTK